MRIESKHVQEEIWVVLASMLDCSRVGRGFSHTLNFETLKYNSSWIVFVQAHFGLYANVSKFIGFAFENLVLERHSLR